MARTVKIRRPAPFKSSQRIKDWVAVACSYVFNPRNLEVQWYPAYTQTLSDLVDFRINPLGTLSAPQQYKMSLSSEVMQKLGIMEAPEETDDEESGDDGYSDGGLLDAMDAHDDDDDEDEDLDTASAFGLTQGGNLPSTNEGGGEPGNDDAGAPTESTPPMGQLPIDHTRQQRAKKVAIVYQPQDDSRGGEDDPGIGDLSMTTTAATTPDHLAKDYQPDATVFHIQTAKRTAPADKKSAAYEAFWRRLGLQAIHQCYLLLAEFKRSPSRRLRGAVFAKALKYLLEAAERQLLVYAAIHFELNKHASSVIAVSGAGPWWRWVEVYREDMPSTLEVFADDADANEELKNELFAAEDRLLSRFRKAKLRYLGRWDSDQEWTKLRDTALIPMLTRHDAEYAEPQVSSGSASPHRSEPVDDQAAQDDAIPAGGPTSNSRSGGTGKGKEPERGPGRKSRRTGSDEGEVAEGAQNEPGVRRSGRNKGKDDPAEVQVGGQGESAPRRSSRMTGKGKGKDTKVPAEEQGEPVPSRNLRSMRGGKSNTAADPTEEHGEPGPSRKSRKTRSGNGQEPTGQSGSSSTRTKAPKKTKRQ